jgi:hypothetical protein
VAPLTFSALLVLLLVVQFAVASRTPLPGDPGVAPRRPRPLGAQAIPAYPALASGSVFSPARAGDGSGTEVGSGAADTCAAVGVSIVGHDVTALIKVRGASSQLVRVGQTVCGWKVSQIERNTVELVRSGQRRTLVVGQQPPSSDVPATQPQGPETVE